MAAARKETVKKTPTKKAEEKPKCRADFKNWDEYHKYTGPKY